ncbi:LacI family transcriptional regulator [Paenibacillus glucanolyticus]|uniref:substrate-binding domain-containing protein n=1 Tax=Paenibacillus TaxID=44249 RepID=UPI0003E2863C|nr:MULTISPECIES: substrate-binding domain-containing protein [Paenibacillus]ANA82880.1 LacI family transcriptional regulator [Paenibacillus glucanolyticus]AVV58033.1 LacI family transcriptional regulator [Paenibacillus glucanolyticus]ETT42773.1 periplasmic-binding protein/LacI transcriptional regulator [Paenibacillus sp. FSL R5-808]MDH6670588.1 ribose transport system substrate-binding protein [Paenibacillus sp. LBL]MPY17908.1 ABC transporter substrate-binding protein [Paenibacillus glucanolyt
MKSYLSMRYIVMLLIPALIVGYAILQWSKDEPRPKKIIVGVKAVEEIEFWRVLIEGVNTASREFGVDVSVVGPPREIQVDLQIQMLQEAIKQQPDAIVMAAGDYNRLVPTVESIRKAGIPLIMIDSAVNGDYAQSLIATDNFNAGQKAAVELAERLPVNAKVAIVSFVQGTSTQIEREQGVRSILEQREGTEIVGTYYSEGMEERAYEITMELLRERPDLDGIVGLNEPSTVGAGRAIGEQGLVGKVKLVGFDSSIKEVKLLEEGVLQSTIVQKPFSIGYLGIKTAVSLIEGDKVSPNVYTDSVIINKDNMYTEENQKLLFPFVEE